MKIIKKILILFIIMVPLTACGSIKKGFQNDKKGGSEAFLVEKKSPLIMPPSYGQLPEPKELKKKEEEKTDIKKIVTGSKSTTEKIEKKSSVEKLILEKIKKN